ncbi:MBL fold metallo-hydrolase [Pokkaliibacter sp. CJK22405]|uniref:MBL fold metallo-hydrolase n=1 Tax=Pokkaliibacter sp. CJK22405 TaxID=3384615 RepID=UPI0039854DCE
MTRLFPARSSHASAYPGLSRRASWLMTLSTALMLMASLLAAPVQAAPAYTIDKMKDNVYRYTAGNYRSVFMVTTEGIVVTDPINPEAAASLKAALQKEFNLPIKYMIYSHNHADHTLGGEVFKAAGATVVAQRYAAEDIAWTRLPTAMPEVTFKDKMTVSLGNSWVDLEYHGPNNGRGSISMRFMPANVMYVVDWIVIGRMPYKDLQGYDIHGMIRSTREILAEPDFDLFVGGHAEKGSREDVEQYLGYIEALYTAVRDGMLAGKDLPTLQQEIRLPAYKDLKMYDAWLPLNIEGVYNTFINDSYFRFRTDIPGQEKS